MNNQKAQADENAANLMRQYPQARLIRWDAFIVVTAWLLLAAAGVAVVLIALVEPAAMEWAMAVLYLGISLTALHVVMAFIHKCPVCTKRPMIEGFTPVHPNAALQSKLKGWAGVA